MGAKRAESRKIAELVKEVKEVKERKESIAKELREMVDGMDIEKMKKWLLMDGDVEGCGSGEE
jgi:archaellum component FlaC